MKIQSKRDLVIGVGVGLLPMYIFANNIDLDEVQKTLTSLFGLAALVVANLKVFRQEKEKA